jgi:uncharacterized protein (TIGR02722 family)
MKNTYILILFVTFLAFVTACSPTLKVDRVDPTTQTDLTGKWNDTDARLVSEEMINDVLDKPWYEQFKKDHNNLNPVVIVGAVRNETMEHIDTKIFTKEIERVFINSGLVDVVASSEERGEIRQERVEQQSFASLESVKAMGRELGADLMLIGNVSSIKDQSINKRQSALFYTVNMELIDIETNRKLWFGNKQIKKIVQKRGLGR